MEQIKVANTTKAHFLLHEAHEQRLQWAYKMRLLKAYFTEGKSIDDIQVLQERAQEIVFQTFFGIEPFDEFFHSSFVAIARGEQKKGE